MNHTITIDKIIHGGQGLGRLDNGMVVLTRFVLQGEEVVVKEIKKHRGHIDAEPLEILRPSPDREVPPCPFYMRCGGCDFQHMNITAQQKAKDNIVRESLQRVGVTVDEQTFRQISPSPEPFFYRYRIRLKVSLDGAVGFHQAGSNNIVDIGYCRVATETLNKALDELRVSGFIETIAQIVREIELLHSPADNKIFCILHPYRDKPQIRDELADRIPSMGIITGIFLQVQRNIEPLVSTNQKQVLRQNFDESICGKPYSITWTPGCFSQVNAKQNANLIRLAYQLAGKIKGDKVLDLFCGMGNFSIPFALQGAMVTGIERHTACIEEAIDNGTQYSLINTRFLDRDVHKWLRKAVKKQERYTTVLLDPPRQGMGKSITLLAELSPVKIIYISCDPATLSRDIAHLTKRGYTLNSVTPVDMFPQTHHIESVALLEKN